MLNILTDAIERNLKVDLVFLDFAKTFDSVTHGKLIHKLEKYGISGPVNTLDKRFPVKQKKTSTCHRRIM